MKFFSHEKYHYSRNLKIEQELREFKQEIEMKFKRSRMNKAYRFPRKQSGSEVSPNRLSTSPLSSSFPKKTKALCSSTREMRN